MTAHAPPIVVAQPVVAAVPPQQQQQQLQVPPGVGAGGVMEVVALDDTQLHPSVPLDLPPGVTLSAKAEVGEPGAEEKKKEEEEEEEEEEEVDKPIKLISRHSYMLTYQVPVEFVNVSYAHKKCLCPLL